ncbi:MAG: bacteriohemerythrin [Candidatus Pacebacteria bacterium]|nr:bacteriohemerythrin [Candidatus Paceibacterota bacterium]
MNKFVWTPKYSVGIDSIDDQHKHFFDMANKTMELAGESKTEPRTIFEALEELGDYAFYHFGTEEDYFDSLHYTEADAHKSIHNTFRQKIQNIMTSAREGENIHKIAKEAASFAGDWLFNHILEMDKKYAVFFHEHGVK